MPASFCTCSTLWNLHHLSAGIGKAIVVLRSTKYIRRIAHIACIPCRDQNILPCREGSETEIQTFTVDRSTGTCTIECGMLLSPQTQMFGHYSVDVLGLVNAHYRTASVWFSKAANPCALLCVLVVLVFERISWRFMVVGGLDLLY